MRRVPRCAGRRGARRGRPGPTCPQVTPRPELEARVLDVARRAARSWSSRAPQPEPRRRRVLLVGALAGGRRGGSRGRGDERGPGPGPGRAGRPARRARGGGIAPGRRRPAHGAGHGRSPRAAAGARRAGLARLYARPSTASRRPPAPAPRRCSALARHPGAERHRPAGAATGTRLSAVGDHRRPGGERRRLHARAPTASAASSPRWRFNGPPAALAVTLEPEGGVPAARPGRSTWCRPTDARSAASGSRRGRTRAD